MKKKIVLCVGDSLGLPRLELSFIKTWYFLLASKYTNFIFVNNFHRALTTKELFNKDFLENYNPNIVVLQVGIVDCAPRYFKQGSIFPKIINKMPEKIKFFFWIYLKKIKKRKNKLSDVLPNEFKLNLINYFDRCLKNGVEKLVIILIQKPGILMIKKNPTIIQNIDLYNSIVLDIIKEYDFIQIINPLSDAEELNYISDGYHLSNIGAIKVYEDLIKIFKNES
jgi:acyl-CoA thioesterase-1